MPKIDDLLLIIGNKEVQIFYLIMENNDLKVELEKLRKGGDNGKPECTEEPKSTHAT